ncbi:hypothetical protein [Chryseobacterium caseinilyticum]|uniref:DUF3892 domain-containing protein n=1 Tax=Chryseobacterium caseinilyticum TaxID=2771428 RepID=A0ABR8ZGW6_9FLAO|nr:hypothetical protein [Chryseobacterium caseinilyticum]MBD8084502.1 hypothetical protein [Chryseobacterium caseinilyticum]
MKLNLLLCPRDSRTPAIHHIVEAGTNLQIGDTFEYGTYYYSQLDKDTQKSFIYGDLEKGIYRVIDVKKHDDVDDDNFTDIILQLI